MGAGDGDYDCQQWLPAVLTGYAYETIPGKAIIAGAAGVEEVGAMNPAPTTVSTPRLGMFCAGALGSGGGMSLRTGSECPGASVKKQVPSPPLRAGSE